MRRDSSSENSSIAAGTYPDVVYLYGSWAANIAKSGKTVDLSDRVDEPGFAWDDFWDSSKQIVSPGGKVIGFPALIDNLSVIYNKDIFKKLSGKSLSDDAFHDKATAHDNSDRILYQKKTGMLFYDADGKKDAHDPILFAVLDNHAKIDAGDFLIV